MKKLLLLAATASMVLVSCSDDFGNNVISQEEGKSIIRASFQVGENQQSRTSFTPNSSNTNFNYNWDKTDVIGVFNASENDYTNEPFAYNGNGVFSGQLEMFAEDSFYAYYPWSANTEVADGSIEVYISRNQNYNWSAAQNDPASKYRIRGSFASNAAPAVAKGTVNTDGELELKFAPVASYVVAPIVGYTGNTPIKKVTLSAIDKGNSDAPIQLAGTISVLMNNVTENGTLTSGYNPGVAEATGTSASSYNTITLNVANGIELNPGDTTWLWFVVPADLPTTNTEFTLTLNDTPFTTTLNAKDYTVNGANGLQPIFQNFEKQTPFNYNPSNTFFIETEQQFLEYAYLATNWNTAKEEYQGIEEYYLGKDIPSDEIAEMMSKYSSFEYMVDDATDPKSLNPAVISKSLTFDPDAIMAWLTDEETNNTATPNSRGGVVQIPPVVQPQPVIAPYFENAYYNYANNKALKPIGGGITASITAKEGVSVSINNLDIAGNGMFGTATSTNKVTVTNVTFQNCTVTPSNTNVPGYLFYNEMGANGTGLIMNGVSVVDCSVATETSALFNSCYSNWLNEVIGYIAAKPSTMAYFNILQVNTGVNLSSFDLATDFNSIVVNSWNNFVVRIADKTQAEQFMAIAEIKVNTRGEQTAFSLSDGETSYWTGTAYETDNYAEGLAYAVQNAKESVSLGKFDLDLMGENWWNAYEEAGALKVTLTDDVEISGVSINGLNKDEEEITYLTLLGNKVSVTGENTLTVSDINVILAKDYEAAEGAVIAAIGNTPGEENKATIVVTQMNVTADAETFATVGGLYASLNDTTVGNVTNGSKVVNETAAGLKSGYLAGAYDFEANEANVTLTMPSDATANAFGVINVTVTPIENSSTTLTLPEGLGLSDINLIAGDSMESGYYVAVKVGKATTYFKYNGKTFDNEGTIQPSSFKAPKYVKF